MIVMPVIVHAQAPSMAVTSKLSMEVTPGASQTAELYIKNPSTANNLELKLDVIDFTYKDSSGVPVFLETIDTVPTRWSLSPFVTLPETVTVKAGEVLRQPFTVTIPNTIAPGSYYSAIRYRPAAAVKGGVGIVSTNSTLVFLNVRGTVRQSAQISQVGFQMNSDTAVQRWFWSARPRYLSFQITNSGNTVIEPGGSAVVSSLFGGQDYVLPVVNSQNERALINQTRLFSTCMVTDKKSGRCTTQLHPGLYRVKLYLAYAFPGSETEDFRSSFLLWVVPWWLAMILILMLVVIGFGLWQLLLFGKKQRKPKSKRVHRFKV
jgi:hypothetical protein